MYFLLYKTDAFGSLKAPSIKFFLIAQFLIRRKEIDYQIAMNVDVDDQYEEEVET